MQIVDVQPQRGRSPGRSIDGPKALRDQCRWIKVFPPGHTYSSTGGLRSYYHPDWFGGTRRPAPPGAGLRERFEAAVGKRLMSDVPFGTLLSGGLDSSLVTAVAADLARRTGAGTRLPSFSIGTDADAPDLRMARAVAAHVGTDHHEVHFRSGR